MDFTNLIDDDKAVSPVIGVILMVAITVILAAVIGTFVLGLGDQVQSTTPQASFGFETTNVGDGDGTNDQVTVVHESGDTIDTNSLKVTVGSTTAYEDGSANTDPANLNVDGWTGSSVSAGSSLTINEDGGGSVWDSGETTVRVIYDSPDSDSSSTLGKFTFTADST